VVVSGQQLAAAETTSNMRGTAHNAPDNEYVEGENHDERNRRITGELDVVERDVHEPVVRQWHTLRNTSLDLDEVDRQSKLSKTVQAK